MKLSIVTPVYNEPRVGQALDSILAQQHTAEMELHVIDGGSTDTTLAVLEGYRGDITRLVSEPDEGIYDAMNKGIALCTGDVVGILNADDRYSDPQVLADVLNAFQDDGVDACYGDQVFVNRNDRVVRYWKSGPYRAVRLYLGWMPPHPTFFVRRRVYEQFGVFDTRYQIAADYELMLRLLLKHGISVKYLDRVLVRMAKGGKSSPSTVNAARGSIEVVKAWRRNDLPFGYVASALKLARKPLQFLGHPTENQQRASR